MKRRLFLKRSMIFTGLIWVPKIVAQVGLRSPGFVGNLGNGAAGGGGGSIAFDAASGSDQDSSGTTLTFAHTVASGGVLVVIAAYLGDSPTISGVTYDTVALTQLLGTTDNSGGVGAKISAWAIHNPTTGSSKNIVITYSATGGGYFAGIGLSYTGVVNSSVAAMHRTIYSGGAGGGGADLTVVDSQSGDMVVCGLANWASNPTSGQTLRKEQLDAGTGTYDLSASDKVATGGNTAMTWTNDDFTTICGFALIKA